MTTKTTGISTGAKLQHDLVRDDHYYRLKIDIEDFYYREADLLDDRRFTEWLEILDEDLIYFMPIRRNVKFGQHREKENTRQGEGISWFDEDKWTLSKRVDQILTGVHYAEEPLSRITHMVTNVQLLDIRGEGLGSEIDVRSRFFVYQNRVEEETYTFCGRRTDTLRMTADGWKVAAREILLEQSVLQAKSLTTFF